MSKALNIVKRYYPKVTRVIDAKSSITVSVTKADCAYSRRKSPDSCAMARALQKEYDGAVVSLSVAYLVKGDKATRYIVPNRIARELVSFDRNHEFAPGTYALNQPNKTHRIGPRRHPQPKNKGSYSRHKIRRHRSAGVRSL